MTINNNTQEITIESVLDYEVDSRLPVRKHHDDAGADLQSSEKVTLHAGEHKLVSTGVRIQLPENTVGFITPRSGLAGKHGITVLNAPGTVDAGYTGELKVILINHSDKEYSIEVGDRIAQLVVCPVLFPKFEEVNNFAVEETEKVRGQSGFGSTGKG